MAATNITIGVDVTGLGDEVHVRNRYPTNTAPTAIQRGYGTILAANTAEAVVLGQCAASLIDSFYIKAIDGKVYVNPTAVSSVRVLAVASGESQVFKPVATVVLSVGVWASVAGTSYEYLITGLSS